MPGDPRWMLDEAVLQREVLLAVGRYQRVHPTCDAMVNFVGGAYALDVARDIASALQPFGREVVGVALAALSKRRFQIGDVGSPDIIGHVDGRWIGLELKRAGGVAADGRRVPPGVVEPHQQQWHEAARRRGAVVEVVRDPGMVEVVLERVRVGR